MLPIYFSAFNERPLQWHANLETASYNIHAYVRETITKFFTQNECTASTDFLSKTATCSLLDQSCSRVLRRSFVLRGWG